MARYDSRSKRKTQPVRVPTGGDYGDRQQLEGAQQAVPLPQDQGPAPAAAAQPPAAGAAPFPDDGIFGPTARPGEPITAGVPVGPGPDGPPQFEDNDNWLLNAVIAAYPHPDLIALLDG